MSKSARKQKGPHPFDVATLWAANASDEQIDGARPESIARSYGLSMNDATMIIRTELKKRGRL